MAPENSANRHLIRATRRSLVPLPFPPRRDIGFADGQTGTNDSAILFRDVFWVRRLRMCCYLARLQSGNESEIAVALVLKELLRTAMRSWAADRAVGGSLDALRNLGLEATGLDLAAASLRIDTGEATFASVGTGTAIRLPAATADAPNSDARPYRVRLACGDFVWLSVGEVAPPSLAGGHARDAADLVRSALAGRQNAAAVAIELRTLHQRCERTFILANDVEGIGPILADINDYLLSEGLMEEALTGLDFALDEMLTNVVLYAYDDGLAHEICIQLHLREDLLRIEVRDDGVPFDPTTAAAADTSSDLDERPIGGLGLHLVQQVFDTVTYRRVRGWNTLVLDRRLAPTARVGRAVADARAVSEGSV